MEWIAKEQQEFANIQNLNLIFTQLNLEKLFTSIYTMKSIELIARGMFGLKSML